MNNQNPLLKLRELGQSVWLDFIRKEMLFSGALESLINDDGILGITSNPSIFEKAINSSSDYGTAIAEAALEGRTTPEIYQLLTISDIQRACDLFQSTYESKKYKDGFVSLEVSPQLAYETEKTLIQARELWKKVARPNLLIKVPATLEGIPAIKQLITEGINVNATLLFSIERYREVAEAFISGLEARVAKGQSIDRIASVASFFLSRIDTAVDSCLDFDSPLRGTIAIASAKMAYQKYISLFESSRFEKLKARGAFAQRLLWASTSTKNPSDSDTKYVEALIGRDTINTLPLETLNAYRNHGHPIASLESDVKDASSNIELLKNLDIDLKLITQELEDEGVHKFTSSFDTLLTSLEIKRQNALGKEPKNLLANKNLTFFNFGDTLQNGLKKLREENFSNRIWRKDASLWTQNPKTQEAIRNSLGWLNIAEKMEDLIDSDIKTFVKDIRNAGFEQVVHMGMGGSSLAALVLSRSFSEILTTKDGLPLRVLDTTNPETIYKLKNDIKIEKTLFIVASKSGTTAEPLAFKDYFYECVRQIKGDRAGENFVAITDPGTPLVKLAKDQNFRRIFYGSPDIGGRYSALSYFGVIPAALMGMNVKEMMAHALTGANSTHSSVPSLDSEAAILGAALGEMAQKKRNKITLIIEKPFDSMGLWLEQLMAESTGKEGKGLIPISGETLGDSTIYGEDRLFIYLTCKAAHASATDKSYNEVLKKSASALRAAGQAFVHIEISDLNDLGREFFDWEFATAVAGSILQINAFDQPNVQESKDITDKLLAQPNENKSSEDLPQVNEGSLSFFSKSNSQSGIAIFTEFFEQANLGDYIALMAFVPESPETSKMLHNVRISLRDKFKLATTLGYGPRFLHSTGQLHKGGPNTGLFIQLTSDDAVDLAIPGRTYTFGDFKRAQAKGDLEALRKHDRRTLRIHLGAHLVNGLRELEELVRVSLELK